MGKITCLTCEYSMISGINSWCRKEDHFISKDEIIDGKPDWCPLPDAPERGEK